MASDASRESAAPARFPVRGLSLQFAAAVRWLHIYVSLLSFTSLVFFGITGITLNHPTWFGADTQKVIEHRGHLKPEWLNASSANSASADTVSAGEPSTGVAKLEIVEHLRSAHGLRGSISEFRIEEHECLVLFKGPGYSADAVIDRPSGTYTATVTLMGTVAILNDLHKGRDTGPYWSIFIDVISIVTAFVSVTGLILIFYLRRKRLSGILTAVAGTILFALLIMWLLSL